MNASTIPTCILISTLASFAQAQSSLEPSPQTPTQFRVDHTELAARKASRDTALRRLSEGVLEMRKTKYASRVGNIEIPAYVFAPLEKRGRHGHPALVWVHGGVHGDLTPNYWPYIREATTRGYVVVCPEYRGSTGYGKAHYDAIDYGGFEIEDCMSAVHWMAATMPFVDTERVAIIGWSHGGFIALHAVTRDPDLFRAAVSIVPVTNLVHRLSYKPPSYAAKYVKQERIAGLPHERTERYLARSPLYQVDRIRTPLLVHVAKNDAIIPYHETEMLIHALRIKKPELVETRVYEAPHDGHQFNRLVESEDPARARLTPESRDSWNRIWTFLEWHLRPYQVERERKYALPDLNTIWIWSDPARSNSRFRMQIREAGRAGDRDSWATLWTQVARSQGMQRKFDEARESLGLVARLLEKQDLPRARVYWLLESGRLLNSSGSPRDALRYFEDAWSLARRNAFDALAVDAAHMIAIASKPEDSIVWHERALALSTASDEVAARRWRATLLNNLGWTQHDLGSFEDALANFKEAVVLREEQGNPVPVRIGRWAVARTLRSLGRIDEALAIQRELEAAWAEAKRPDAYVFEEIGECLHAQGKTGDAAPYFRQAHAILSQDAWFVKNEKVRLERMKKLGLDK